MERSVVADDALLCRLFRCRSLGAMWSSLSSYVPLLLVSPVAVLVLLRLWSKYQARSANLRGKHFLITGGSSGIGRALALEVVRRGANVTVLARNRDRLEQTKLETLEQASSPEQAVHTIAADLTSELGALSREVQDAEEVCGPVDFLINCAGSATSQRFDETPMSDFRRMMELNYLSAVQATKAVLPGMKLRGQGSVVFVSSIAGVFGVYGFSAYCPAKFALVGFAEALRMEVKHRGVCVTVAFPPDTDTPGFAEENRCKPLETKLISASGGVHSADVVARAILHDVLEGNFVSVLGWDGMASLTLCAGMMPPSSLLQLGLQVLTMGPLRLIGAMYLAYFDRLVARCAATREQGKKSL